VPSYRFCRPDNLPLLVRAVNECYDVHFPDDRPMTEDRFRRDMKELDVWPSNSMVALSGQSGQAGDATGDPQAVLIGTKRDDEVLIHRLGVHPDHLRRGHGSHLVTSLSQKLAVLGPPRLAVEVPADREDLAAFFTGLDFWEDGELTDYERPKAAPWAIPSPPDGVVEAAGVEDLVGDGVLDGGVAWERRWETLTQRGDRLLGASVASPERYEAWVVYEPPVGGRTRTEIWEVGALEGSEAKAHLGTLLRHVADLTGADLALSKLAPGEVDAGLLETCGFQPTRRHVLYRADAKPL
jgi:GNAT superfamily N-acetyltransferase